MKIQNVFFVMTIMIFELDGAAAFFRQTFRNAGRNAENIFNELRKPNTYETRIKEVENTIENIKKYTPKDLEFNNAQKALLKKEAELAKLQKEYNKDVLMPAGVLIGGVAGLGGAVVYKELTREDYEPQGERSWIRNYFGRDALLSSQNKSSNKEESQVNQSVPVGHTSQEKSTSKNLSDNGLGWKERFFADLKNYNPLEGIKNQFNDFSQNYGYGKSEGNSDILNKQKQELEQELIKADNFFANVNQLLDRENNFSIHTRLQLEQKINELFKNEFGTKGSLYDKDFYRNSVKNLIAERIAKEEYETQKHRGDSSFTRGIYMLDDHFGITEGLGKIKSKIEPLLMK
jgi:hypothetical protein